MKHEEYLQNILKTDDLGRLKVRERTDLEFKRSFSVDNWTTYAKTMAAFANNRGGYMIFGIKDNPQEVIGVNNAFKDFQQEKFTAALNDFFSPEIEWEPGTAIVDGKTIGYIYTEEAIDKPTIAIKSHSNGIISGDVFYRYHARSEKIKFPEMHRIISEIINKEREKLLNQLQKIWKSGETNIGIINYSDGHLSTPYGVDVAIDKELILKILKRAKFIKRGSFSENGTPVLRVTGDVDLAETIPVPAVDPNIQYPYNQKVIAEELGINGHDVQALVWHYQLKGNKKYHMEIAMSPKCDILHHKFSINALLLLKKNLSDHENDSSFLKKIKIAYNNRNKMKLQN